eukprot:m.2909 g.2909  ORF g.2909 m.2909 type:complete len:124 (-) comp1972_c0_seq2:170-541(-)
MPLNRRLDDYGDGEGEEDGRDDTSIFIDDHLTRRPTRDASSKRVEGGIDDLIMQGTKILSDLDEQGEVIKRIKRGLLDIGNTLGLSNTVMRMIEQRSTQDMYILVAGMIITVVIMILVFIYLR